MKLSRSSRLVVALIALFGILFAQYAMASYTCPAVNPTHMTQAVAMPMDMDHMQGMSGCAGMDDMQPSLCHAHDQVGNQSLDKPDSPQVQPFVAVGLTLLLTPIDITFPPVSTQPDSRELTRSIAPPLSIRHCCFRI
jgi:hypothetical protein